MKLKNLIDVLPEKELYGDLDRDVKNIVYDSRRAEVGSLFVALRGTKTDGHKYVKSAISNGAIGVVAEEEMPFEKIPVIKVPDTRVALARLAEKFYGYPAKKLKIIGITGTNGKTTTAHMVSSILEEYGIPTGVMGTLYIKIGDEKYKANMTTPESLDIQRYLSKMVEKGIQAVVMEVSSHALHFNRVMGLSFDGAIFTNLSQDHLDFHKDMEEYFLAKRKLFYMIKEGGFALLNADDLRTPQIIKVLVDVPYKTYGIYRMCDIRAKNIEKSIYGTSFVAESSRWDIPIKMKLVGEFNIYNALASVGVGLFMDIPPAIISSGIAKLKGVRGRFELIEEGQNFGVVVDYAHTPDGLRKVLKAAKELTQRRLITVFGCGGDRDRKKRPIMGEIAAEYSDVVVITSDNPRTEDPKSIIAEIQVGVAKKRGDYLVFVDRREAIFEAIGMAEEGDLVVIAGKGHEDYQIFGTKRVHFDDAEVAREAISVRMKREEVRF